MSIDQRSLKRIVDLKVIKVMVELTFYPVQMNVLMIDSRSLYYSTRWEEVFVVFFPYLSYVNIYEFER